MAARQSSDGGILAGNELELYSPGPVTFEWLVDEIEEELMAFQYLSEEEGKIIIE
jgi:hypothetical protein